MTNGFDRRLDFPPFEWLLWSRLDLTEKTDQDGVLGRPGKV
jgi:hypothetical protein